MLASWVVGAGLLALVVGLAIIAVTLPAQIAAYSGLLSTLFAAVSAVGAWQALREANQERRERRRPVVQADCPISSSSEVFFRLTNSGGSAAENITVTFHPSPIDFDGRQLAEISLFRSPIPLLTPGQEIKHLFQLGFNFAKPDIPSVFDVRVAYRSKGTEYAETTRIDLSVYRDLVLPRPTIAESLADISQTLKKVKDALGTR